jgi:hypothetical protein
MAMPLSEKENFAILFLTIVLILINYITYSGAEALLAADLLQPGSLMAGFLSALAFPIRAYIELYESRFFVPVPFVGRVINYLVELGYFVTLTTAAYLGARAFVRFTTKSKT